jgi:NAD(P)-dependent dehydrogenase (short-subunit alcohol dehydrogenase family)
MRSLKTIIVTGANSGLGIWTTKYLLDANCKVIMACRNIGKAKADVDNFVAIKNKTNIQLTRLDLADLHSIQLFVSNLSEFENIYGVVCNAGIMHSGEMQYTKDGIEETFGTNYLGHFYLMQLLLQKFSINKFVVISSALHDPKIKSPFASAKLLSVDEIAYPKLCNTKYLKLQNEACYATSKLCLILFAYQLNRNLIDNGDGLHTTVNAYNPGFMPSTHLGRREGRKDKVYRWILGIIGCLFRFSTTAKISGKDVARLVMQEKQTGHYFQGHKAIASSAESYDLIKEKTLWLQTEKLISALTN